MHGIITVKPDSYLLRWQKILLITSTCSPSLLIPWGYSKLSRASVCSFCGFTLFVHLKESFLGRTVLKSRLYAYTQERESERCSVVSDSLQPHGLYSPWNSLGQNTGVGSLSLLQGIFPTQGLNPGLPHCGHILYQLSYKGSPRILEWVAYPFSSRSSWPRNWTGVSYIAGRFFTSWAICFNQNLLLFIPWWEFSSQESW